MTEIEDEWLDVEKSVTSAALLPPVQVRISQPSKPGAKCKAWVVFRREQADWIKANGPRFRLQIAGAAANKLRFVPDMHKGRFEFSVSPHASASVRMALGHINLWPNELREPTAPHVSTDAQGNLVLELPAEWTKPRLKALPPPPSQPSASPQKTPPFPINTAAPGLGRVIDRRPVAGPVPMGEPAPGRSALDQRRGKEKG